MQRRCVLVWKVKESRAHFILRLMAAVAYNVACLYMYVLVLGTALYVDDCQGIWSCIGNYIWSKGAFLSLLHVCNWLTQSFVEEQGRSGHCSLHLSFSHQIRGWYCNGGNSSSPIRWVSDHQTFWGPGNSGTELLPRIDGCPKFLKGQPLVLGNGYLPTGLTFYSGLTS